MSRNVCAECGAVISMSEVRGLCCSADPSHFGMLQPRESDKDDVLSVLDGVRQSIIERNNGAVVGENHDMELYRAQGVGECIQAVREMQRPLSCEWEDLKGLDGRELRERLRSRASVWHGAVIFLMGKKNQCQPEYVEDKADLQILIDLIQCKSQACEVEASRLWEQHLQDLTTWYIEEDPSYVVLLERAGNPQYAHIIVERAAQRRLQEVS